jgi:hypothetical protein
VASDPDPNEVIRLYVGGKGEQRTALGEARAKYGQLIAMTMVGVDGEYVVYMPDAEHKYRAKRQHAAPEDGGPERSPEQRRMMLDRLEQIHAEEQQKTATATKRAEPFMGGRRPDSVGPLTKYLRKTCHEIGSRSFDRVLREISNRVGDAADEAQEVDDDNELVYFRFADEPVAFKTIRNRLSEIGKQKKNPGKL